MTTGKTQYNNHLDIQPYTEDYYSYSEEGSRLSAKVIVPLILELVHPKSVIDVGCGTGEWLAVFKENGVEDVWGVDGEYVNKQLLKIPKERFIAADLEQPFRMARKFDLVVSLEVAEHLPKRCAEPFVGSLTELGPLVLFSAAIPHQGGVHHVNEQWPEYWAKLFSDKGYVTADPVRGEVWNKQEVKWWYAQNTLMFVKREWWGKYPLLKEYKVQDPSMLSIVHPSLYLLKIRQAQKEAKLQNDLARKARNILPHSIYRLLHGAYRLLLGFAKGTA